jgi:HAD superfamily hydrolase (TIGR01509 family)
MPIKAVLFDLGDTLIFQAHTPDPTVLFSEMALRVQPLLDAWGVALPIELPTLLSEISQAVETAQPARRARGYEVDGAFIARGALAAYGVNVSAEMAAQFWSATDVGLAAWGAQTYPDTSQTLARLRTMELPVGLVSNSSATSAMLRAGLATVGIAEELLPVIVTSTDVMRPKPHPAPFERALGLLGVAAADAVFVGDDLDADVRGSKALGMTSVWKLNGRHEVDLPPEADYAIHDLWELFTLDLLPGGAKAALPQDSLTPHEDANADRY